MKRSSIAKSALSLGVVLIIIVVVSGIWRASAINANEENCRDSSAEKVNQSEDYFGDLCMVRIPANIPSQEKDYTGFRVSFNKDNMTPNWVAWELLGSETVGTEVRESRQFWKDKEIDGCADTKDYTRSGYYLGHI